MNASAARSGCVQAFVLHWDVLTLPQVVEVVRAAGAEIVGSEAEDGRRAHDEVRRLAPHVLVAWLTWKPSHTRVTCAAIRSTAWGRKLPIVLVDDPTAPAPAALRRQLKEILPDAIVDTPDRLTFWFGRIAALPAPQSNP